MSKSTLIAVCLVSMHLLTAPAQERRRPAENKRDTSYTLIWADEFDHKGAPDPNQWTYEKGFVRNRELQWYQPENARCENGMLIIEARRARKQNPQYSAGSRNWAQSREYAEYTSSSVTTRGLHSWRYGRFEMRARIDTRAGLWPAFWTLGIVRGAAPTRFERDLPPAAWITGRSRSPSRLSCSIAYRIARFEPSSIFQHFIMNRKISPRSMTIRSLVACV